MAGIFSLMPQNFPATSANLINSFKAKKMIFTPTTTKSIAKNNSPRHVNCLYQNNKIVYDLEQPVRRSANYQPSLWTDEFLQSMAPSNSNSQHENGTRIERLKMDVIQLLHESYKEERSQLQLIDELEQLGVAYHFKEEIHYALSTISNSLDRVILAIQDDLCSMGLLFRLLRQHGFEISQDVFNLYKDEKGNFKPSLMHDIKGTISLYQASHLAKEEESLMDEVRIFTEAQLKYFLKETVQLDSCIKEHVIYALELPLDWRMERLHHKWFIEAYQREESMNPVLLELAKLDYNDVQIIFQNEIKKASRWWKNVGLAQKLPFSRDRLMENYFWAVGFCFDPNSGAFREASTKTNCLITAIDDIYDVHGTLDELELFTSVINRWDIEEAHQLPEYMEICFTTLINTINDISNKVIKQRNLDITEFLKRAWADLCNAYMVEAKWYHQGYKPKFEEYLNNAWMSISGPLTIMLSYCLSEHVTDAVLESFNYPSITMLSSNIIRLYDDLATSKDELERGDVLKSIQCYMDKNNVSEEIAREQIKEIIRDNWKQINKQRNYSSYHEKFYKDVAINFARMANCVYQFGDGYARPDGETKDRIISVLIESII